MGSSHWASSQPARRVGASVCYWCAEVPCKHHPDSRAPVSVPPGSEPVIVGVAAEAIQKGERVAVYDDGKVRRYVR